MAESAHARAIAVRRSESTNPRHSAFVRVTHWIATGAFLALVVSGTAILLAHPRFYWGETGGRGAPSLIDLPLPFVLNVPIRGPGRYLHFLSAWIFVFTGFIYVTLGILRNHFRWHLLPEKSQLSWASIRNVVLNHLRFKRPTEDEAYEYNLLQRAAYLAVIFVLVPVMIWSGLAMSPAVTSVFPTIVGILGGQQSARTIHFFVAILLLGFLFVHILMVGLAGFRKRVGAMITGRQDSGRERSCAN